MEDLSRDYWSIEDRGNTGKKRSEFLELSRGFWLTAYLLFDS